MKTIVCLGIAGVVSLAMLTTASAGTVARAIPHQDRIQGVEQAERMHKTREAKKMIEKHGESAFDRFRERSEHWLGKDNPLFVIEATPGGTGEGFFMVFPEVAKKSGVNLSRANGKKLARQVMKKSDQKKAWLGFVHSGPEEPPHAAAVATSPSGKKYVIIVGM